jgi:hypothetical protein
MSDISLVRTLSADPIAYDGASAVSDGVITVFVYPYAPIQPGTAVVRVNGTIQAPVGINVDEDLGIVTFTFPPAAGTVTIAAKHTMISDDQINELLAVNADSADPIRLTAADCLDAIASSEALIQKKLKMLDFETDGAAIAQSLRAGAKALRDLVFNADSANSDDPGFDIAERIDNRAAWREKIYKDILANS